jgi:CHASE2 domain-containing sensor protein/signal transduction histidine kinase
MRFPGRLHRLTVEWWLVAIVSSALVLFLALGRATERMDDLAYDALLHLETHEPDPRILLVTIDNHSLQAVGRWPWPRDVHAELIERLAEAAPSAIAYDVLFLEPAPGDSRLGEAIGRAGPVFLPLLLDRMGSAGSPLAIQPVPPLLEAASGTGHVNLIPDRDGKIRRVRLTERDGAAEWPHLMDIVRRQAQRGAASPSASDSDGIILLPFAGPSGHFPTIGADAVLRGELPAELLRGRIVIVGATAPGLGDRHPVPLSDTAGGMSGVEIQANLLDGLLRGGLADEAGPWLRALFSLAPLWLLLLALRKLRPRTTLVVLPALILLIVAVSAGAFHWLRIWIPPVPALIGPVLVYPLWGWRRLVGVSGYMVGELERLRAEPDILPSVTKATVTTDPVTREAILLGEAVSKLRAMRRFVSDSMDQLPDAVFVVDRDGAITLANRCAQELLDTIDRTNGEPRLQDLLARLEPMFDGSGLSLWPPLGAGRRQEAVAPDGRVFDILSSEHRDENGRPAGWIVRMSDISPIRIAQRQRDDMLHYLTHDMRSPQASILALTSSAEPESIAPALAERIERYAHRTLALADGIVHLARAETLSYEPLLLNLVDVVDDAIDELWPQIREKNIEVEMNRVDEELLLSGEPSLLTRAFINLFDNAAKHSPQGGRLACTVRRRETDAGPVAECLIEDEGEGMATELVATLFERFRRGPAAAASRGAGLGLAIVQTVIARHGGTIRCESRVGEGTTFTLSLPLAAGEKIA